ncbi:hypothetical protein H6503_05690 [Candidatus Woesearchaeota archaeon]|nr:hypothetical protein [Candidatus Woesearchaeota archaeon]
MLNFLLITALYGAHIVIVNVLRGLKNNIASGIDFSLTGAFLAGYWFGWKWGLILGMIFALTNNIVQMEFYPSMFILIPATGVFGIWGSFVAFAGIPILGSVVAGVVVYAIITDVLMMTLFGERDFVMMGGFFLGSLVLNWVFFDLFF